LLYESEDEESVRKSLFERWFSVMTAHNDKPEKSFTMGVNQFSDQVSVTSLLLQQQQIIIPACAYTHIRARMNGESRWDFVVH
jgi:hypothetical protein